MAVHINSLPNEILLEIFSYLPTSSLVLEVTSVCKRWNTLVNDPLLWKEHVFVCDENTTLGEFVKIVSHAPLLGIVRIISNRKYSSNIRHAVNNALNILFHYCRNVRALYLDVFTIDTGYVIVNIVRRLRMLEVLDVRASCASEHTWFGFSDALGKLSPLKKLILPCLWFVGSSTNLKAIADSCVNLAELDISNGRCIKESVLIYLLEKRKETLVLLKIQGDGLSGIFFQKLCMCKKLETLGISNCAKMKNEDFYNIGKLHLKSLSLRSIQVGPRDLCKFFNEGNGSRLTELSLSSSRSVDDQVAESISMNCPLLCILNLSACQVTDCGLTAVLGGCKCLRNLRLTYMSDLTGEFLHIVTKLGKSLKFLVLDESFQKVLCIKTDAFQNIKIEWNS